MKIYRFRFRKKNDKTVYIETSTENDLKRKYGKIFIISRAESLHKINFNK